MPRIKKHKRGDVVGKLTKKELTMFKKNAICKRACKKLIEEVVKHFESSDYELAELWGAAKEKYKFQDDFSYHYDNRTGELICNGSETERELNALISKHSIKKFFRDEIRSAFDLKGKKCSTQD